MGLSTGRPRLVTMRMRNVIALLVAIAAGAASQIVAAAFDLEGLAAYGIVWAAAALLAVTAVPLSLGSGERTGKRPARNPPRR